VNPLVSICLPTYNGSAWIGGALESALAQTYEPIEIVVCDNASTDDTLAVVHSYADDRIRIERGDRNVGLAGNHNRCVLAAQGPLIKFLHDDDVLYPHCVQRMVELFRSCARLGLVFSPRHILSATPGQVDADMRDWIHRYGVLHDGFAQLDRMNDGASLVGQYLSMFMAKGFKENWFGEPSVIMVKRDCFDSVGLFNERLRQSLDAEMWLRIAGSYQVGFVSEPLSAFRLRWNSASRQAEQERSAWLDRLWMLEGLMEDERLRRRYPRLRYLRLREITRVLREQAERLAAGDRDMRPLGGYARHRILSLAGRAPKVHAAPRSL